MQKLYGFGDSLVRGHTLGIGMLDAFAETRDLRLTKFAQNGATVITTRPDDHTWPSDNQVADIGTQIALAPIAAPNLIIFDGFVNDVAQYLSTGLCTINDPNDPRNFYEAFNRVCQQLHAKYPGTPIYYVSVHSMPLLSQFAGNLEQRVRDVTKSLCGKHQIPVIEIMDCDTNDETLAQKYSYNGPEAPDHGDGTHLNAAGYRKFYLPTLIASIPA